MRALVRLSGEGGSGDEEPADVAETTDRREERRVSLGAGVLRTSSSALARALRV